MPAKKSAETKEVAVSNRNYWIILIAVIIIVAAAAAFAVSFFKRGGNGGTVTFEQFESNFASAKRVAIYATDYDINSTTMSGAYTFTCMTTLIGAIVSNRAYHRDPSTIDLYTLNGTSCLIAHGIGKNSTTPINSTVQNCTAQIGTEPTIFINYSASGNATIIKNNYLYTQGDAAFLDECGIASEMN